jgi:hypothetical protein
MIRALFAPITPAEELARERERIARRKPHLALASTQTDPRPNPDMFRWHAVSDLLERA